MIGALAVGLFGIALTAGCVILVNLGAVGILITLGLVRDAWRNLK